VLLLAIHLCGLFLCVQSGDDILSVQQLLIDLLFWLLIHKVGVLSNGLIVEYFHIRQIADYSIKAHFSNAPHT
jgi:hypothetical protein